MSDKPKKGGYSLPTGDDSVSPEKTSPATPFFSQQRKERHFSFNVKAASISDNHNKARSGSPLSSSASPISPASAPDSSDSALQQTAYRPLGPQRSFSG